METSTQNNFNAIYLTDLIAKGDLLSALEELRRILPDNSDIINLMGQYFDERKKYNLSLTSLDSYNVVINRIRNAALSVIEAHQSALATQKPSYFSPFYCIVGHIPNFMEEGRFNKCYLRIAPESLRERIRKELSKKKIKTKDIEEKDIVFDEKPNVITSELVELKQQARIWGTTQKNFTIHAIQNPRQIFGSGAIAEWDYQVTPLSTGQHQLVLKVKTDTSPERIIDKAVDVVSNGSYNYEHALANTKAAAGLPRLRFPNNRFVIFLLPLLVFLFQYAWAITMGLGGIGAACLIGSLTQKSIKVYHHASNNKANFRFRINGSNPDNVLAVSETVFEIKKDYLSLLNPFQENELVISYAKCEPITFRFSVWDAKPFYFSCNGGIPKGQDTIVKPVLCTNCDTFQITCQLDAAYLNTPSFSKNGQSINEVEKISGKTYKLTVIDTFGKNRTLVALFPERTCTKDIRLNKKEMIFDFECVATDIKPIFESTKMIDIQTSPNINEDSRLIVKESYNDSLIYDINYPKGKKRVVELMNNSAYLVEIRSKSCASTTKEPFIVEVVTTNFVVPMSCQATESTVVLKSKAPFKKPTVRIDGKFIKSIKLTEGGKNIEFKYPSGKDMRARTVTIKDYNWVCTNKVSLDKPINIVQLDCQPILRPETYKVTFVLGDNINEYKEYIKINLDGQPRLRNKEYQFIGKQIVMNVYGNYDKNGDGKNEPRDIRIELQLPNKNPLNMCSYNGPIQKNVVVKCNDWVFKTAKK